ncbi:MAG: NAD(P)H-hydrate dehydratase [Actinobacteria bacterium]|nr:NAD(P)H-hydrate dehydratase [Actinomycetota bacterium]
MIPVVTPEEMSAIDRAAPEPFDVLVERAGAAVARAALKLLGGAYGRRVVVVAGKGGNGADGRAAARRLERRGVRCLVFDAAAVGDGLPACDLVVDAAYGTGFRGAWQCPRPAASTPVLAVDIPSAVSGLTGVASGRPLAAHRTVTFAALKPGLLLGEGADLAGDVEVADIGLDASAATAGLVGVTDVAGWLPDPPRSSHKWKAAVWLVAGSPGMTGAAHLAARAAFRAGAGYVRLSSPGVADDPGRPVEAVGVALPGKGWAADVAEGAGRFGAVAVGPGLGLGDGVRHDIADLLRRLPDTPVVVDGDGLSALSLTPDPAALLAGRAAPTILTPHDGEAARLGADTDDPDRLGTTRALAARLGAIVLRKGSTTIVAEPGGRAWFSTTGDARLATAGTGDVLTGVIAALLASGLPGPEAAAAGAFIHGRAGALGWPRGLVAGDLVELLPAVLAGLRRA